MFRYFLRFFSVLLFLFQFLVFIYFISIMSVILKYRNKFCLSINFTDQKSHRNTAKQPHRWLKSEIKELYIQSEVACSITFLIHLKVMEYWHQNLTSKLTMHNQIKLSVALMKILWKIISTWSHLGFPKFFSNIQR